MPTNDESAGWVMVRAESVWFFPKDDMASSCQEFYDKHRTPVMRALRLELAWIGVGKLVERFQALDQAFGDYPHLTRRIF